MAMSAVKVILICGPRNWKKPAAVRAVLDQLVSNYGIGRILIVAGGATGVDTIAEEEAKAMGIHVARVEALWGTYGRRAGPIRNAMMLVLQPDMVIGIHTDHTPGGGTANCLAQADKLGIPVRRITVHTNL
jgi:hypothetical protein